MDDGGYFILDRGAVNKTRIMEGGAWHEIKESYVGLDTPLMLGAFQTTVRSLLAMATKYPGDVKREVAMGVVHRRLDVCNAEPAQPAAPAYDQDLRQGYTPPPMVQPANDAIQQPPIGIAPSMVVYGRPLGKIRDTSTVIILSLVTFGIYQIIWLYGSFEGMKNYRQQGWGGGTYLLFQFVPILHLVTVAVPWLLPSYVGAMYQEDGRPKPITGLAGFWLFVPFAGPFIWMAQINSKLNEFWRLKGAVG